MWTKPEDLELLLECETLPETMTVEGLLRSADLDFVRMKDSDTKTSHLFGGPLMFKDSIARPYKILVRTEDIEEARNLISTAEFVEDENLLGEEEDE